MTDLSGLLGSLSPTVANVLQQVQAGNHAAVPNSQAHEAFQHVTSDLTQAQFQQAAADAYGQLTPDQRSQIAEYLRTQAQQRGIPVPNLPAPAVAANDAGALADATATVHAQGPNILQELFAPGGTFSNPIAKMALLGITAMAAQRLGGAR
jgi:hypothetical protein